jgi:superfamily II DNA/RNA helicase
MLDNIDTQTPHCQGVVIVPTHELASQVMDVIRVVCQKAKVPVRAQMLIGQTNIQRQKDKLKAKPHVVVGTPGRLLELAQSRKLKVHTVNHFICDEADQLLQGNSCGDVLELAKQTLKTRQTICASATLSSEVKQMLEDLSGRLETLQVGEGKINPNIEHHYVEASGLEKMRALWKLIQQIGDAKVILFVHKNESAEDVATVMKKHGCKTSEIHGFCGKQDRKVALDQFRSGKNKLLVSSDLAARGLDIEGVTHVIHVDPPSKSQIYVHRAGRTGRQGASGHSISLISRHEKRCLDVYRKDLGITINKIDV